MCVYLFLIEPIREGYVGATGIQLSGRIQSSGARMVAVPEVLEWIGEETEGSEQSNGAVRRIWNEREGA